MLCHTISHRECAPGCRQLQHASATCAACHQHIHACVCTLPGMRHHDRACNQAVNVQAMAPGGRLDLIKLDIEGEEKELLADPASIAVLCDAICIFMEVRCPRAVHVVREPAQARRCGACVIVLCEVAVERSSVLWCACRPRSVWGSCCTARSNRSCCVHAACRVANA